MPLVQNGQFFNSLLVQGGVLHRPNTLGQAGRVPGVTAAALSLLLVHLKKRG